MRPSIALIIEAVAQEFGLTPNDIRGPSHRKVIAQPRILAMYLAREMTDRSLPYIGRYFGGRHHATVINAQRRALVFLDSPRVSAHLQHCRDVILEACARIEKPDVSWLVRPAEQAEA